MIKLDRLSATGVGVDAGDAEAVPDNAVVAAIVETPKSPAEATTAPNFLNITLPSSSYLEKTREKRQTTPTSAKATIPLCRRKEVGREFVRISGFFVALGDIWGSNDRDE